MKILTIILFSFLVGCVKDPVVPDFVLREKNALLGEKNTCCSDNYLMRPIAWGEVNDSGFVSNYSVYDFYWIAYSDKNGYIQIKTSSGISPRIYNYIQTIKNSKGENWRVFNLDKGSSGEAIIITDNDWTLPGKIFCETNQEGVKNCLFNTALASHVLAILNNGELVRFETRGYFESQATF